MGRLSPGRRLLLVWPGLIGAAWTVVAVLTLAMNWQVVWAGHPAYPVTLCATAAAGLAMIAAGVARSPVRTTHLRLAWRVAGRAATAAGTAALLGALVWLQPLAATGPAVAAMTAPGPMVTASATAITIQPRERADLGLVFQPGAKVDPRAYVPLLREVSRAGVLVVIVKQPYDIGFLAIDAPSSILAAHPGIRAWAVGGHSLGGVAASAYAGAHPARVSGLVLWASYPAGSLTDDNRLHVASIFGSNDTLATPVEVHASRARLPRATRFVEIVGGIHAYFGDYGPQPGDGAAATPREQAQDQIVAATVQLLHSMT